jgi:hypothetical protein
MDEPQVTSQVDETDASTEKSDFNEVLSSAFGEEIEKPMEVDPVASGDEPSTSADILAAETSTQAEEEFAAPAPVEIEEDAGQALDVSMSVSLGEEANESVEHVNIEKPENELDDTIQPTAEGDTLDFTEASINISQLTVEHNDDSNDAFNALKESETDALGTPKEEVEDPKEPEEDPVPTTIDAADETVEPSGDSDISMSAPVPMETEVVSEETEKEPSLEVTEETTDSLEVATETADLDIDDVEETADKPDNEEAEAEEIPDGK